MSLFTQSTKTCSAVIDELTDTIGASADTEMRNRALRSLNAALEHFNTRARWDFLLTDASPIQFVTPFSVGGVTAVSGNSSALVPANHGILIDDLISFAGLSLATRVSATAAGSVGFTTTISSALDPSITTVTAGITRDTYPLPSDYKSVYSLKTVTNQRALRPIRRRFYTRSMTSEFTPTTPVGYDVFPVGGKGKIRILPPPANSDTALLSYYRRLTVASAHNDGTTFDFPQDAEPYVIAYAKWHLCTDKGGDAVERGQTWLTFAEGGIKTMLAEQTNLADEDLAFVPGQYAYDPVGNINSTRNIYYDYGG